MRRDHVLGALKHAITAATLANPTTGRLGDYSESRRAVQLLVQPQRIKKLKNLAALNFTRASLFFAAAKTLFSSISAKIEYATGVTTRVSSKHKLCPPMMVTAIAERCAEPAPIPIAVGINPPMIENVVIRIGLSLT